MSLKKINLNNKNFFKQKTKITDDKKSKSKEIDGRFIRSLGRKKDTTEDKSAFTFSKINLTNKPERPESFENFADSAKQFVVNNDNKKSFLDSLGSNKINDIIEEYSYLSLDNAYEPNNILNNEREHEGISYERNAILPLLTLDLSNIRPETLNGIIKLNKNKTIVDNLIIRKFVEVAMSHDEYGELFKESIDEVKKEAADVLEDINTLKLYNNIAQKTKNIFNLKLNDETYTSEFNDIVFRELSKSKFANSIPDSSGALTNNSFVLTISDALRLDYHNFHEFDNQYIVWLCLFNLKSFLLKGVSNKFLDPQLYNRRLTNFGLKNNELSYVENNVLPLRKIPHVNNINPIEQIALYCCLITSELKNSLALSFLQHNTNLQNIDNVFGISDDYNSNIFYENSLYSNASIDIAGNINVSDKNNSRQFNLFGNKSNSALGHFVNDLETNSINNEFDFIEKALITSKEYHITKKEEYLNAFELFISNNSLLRSSNLFSRILKDFLEIIESINQSDQETTEFKNAVMGFFILKILCGETVNRSSKFKLKNALMKNINQRLIYIRQNRMHENRLAVNNPESTTEFSLNKEFKKSFEDYFKNINTKKSSKSKLKLSVNGNEILKFASLDPSDNNSILYKILNLFLELEEECNNILEDNNISISYIDDLARTNHSKFDAPVFLSFILESYSYLINIFSDFELTSTTFDNNIFDNNRSTKLVNSNIKKDIKAQFNFRKFEFAFQPIEEHKIELIKNTIKAISKNNPDIIFEKLNGVGRDDHVGASTNNRSSVVSPRTFVEVIKKISKENSVNYKLLTIIETINKVAVKHVSTLAEYASAIREINNDNLSSENYSNSVVQFVNTLKNFNTTDNFSLKKLNKVNLNKIDNRFNLIKTMHMPYSFSSNETEIYDILELYIKERQLHNSEYRILVSGLKSEIVNDIIANFEKDNIDKLKLRIDAERINEIIPEQEFDSIALLNDYPLVFSLTDELILYAIKKTKERKRITSYTSILDELNFSNFFNNEQGKFNLEYDTKLKILESYLNKKLVEILLNNDLNFVDNFDDKKIIITNDNIELIESTLDILGFDRSFDELFERDTKDSDTYILNYSNLNMNDANILSIILNSIMFKKGKMADVILKLEKIMDSYGILINEQNIIFNNNNNFNNLLRIDSIYMKSEIST
jgi:hypothetical protein